jgi:hypothetical protein
VPKATKGTGAKGTKGTGTTALQAVVPLHRSIVRRLLVPVATYCTAAVAHGAVVRLHGNTCGVDLFAVSTWHNAIFTVGSTWCRGLAAVVQATTVLSDHSAVHLLSLLL